ncbi:MAG: prephenate dehydratase [Gammaproteobacteria bacterium]
MTDLKKIRQKIDNLDQQIQGLISERAKVAQSVGQTKRAGATPGEYYRPEREAQVLRGVIDRNDGPLRDEEIVRLFREIMSACLAQQEPLKVAFLGPEGTFSQAAVLKHFGHSVRAIALPTIEEVFAEIEGGVADFGIVPIENSTDGTVFNAFDMFVSSKLHICGEVELIIEQHLISRATSVDAVKRIYAHGQSLSQCRGWLKENLPGVELVSVNSNAGAARRARAEEHSAAIAAQSAADVYGLDVLVPNIEDRADNTTRFLVIGRDLFAASGRDKTSLLLSSSHKPGALQALLYTLSTHDINMTRIESRPARRGEQAFVFFVDIEGHTDDQAIAGALSDLGKEGYLLRVLGSYPRAVL